MLLTICLRHNQSIPLVVRADPTDLTYAEGVSSTTPEALGLMMTPFSLGQGPVLEASTVSGFSWGLGEAARLHHSNPVLTITGRCPVSNIQAARATILPHSI